MLLGLGALTNVADALALNPDVAANIKVRSLNDFFVIQVLKTILLETGIHGHGTPHEGSSDDFCFQSPNEPFEIGHG